MRTIKITIPIPNLPQTLPDRKTVLIILLSIGLLVSVICHFRQVVIFSPNFESQVRLWASDYPVELRDKWGWCYLDAATNWSTDQKMREDVRINSVKVLTDDERKTLETLDLQIAKAIPLQGNSLRDVYLSIARGLMVNDWQPPADKSNEEIGEIENYQKQEVITPEPPITPKPEPKPEPTRRRRIMF
jgi:hypothetical protein